ncbi:hypothetical protein D3C74_46600 [compost metagenome]
MRYEFIHVLSSTKDERIMANMIHNMNLESLETFMAHLDYTSSGTRERWLELYGRVLRG